MIGGQTYESKWAKPGSGTGNESNAAFETSTAESCMFQGKSCSTIRVKAGDYYQYYK